MVKKNLTNGEIVALYEGLKQFMGTQDLHMNAINKMHMLCNLKELEGFYSSFESVRNELIVKYGETDLEKQVCTVKVGENMDAYIDELTPILKEVSEVSLYTLNIKDVDDQISVSALEGIMPIIINDEDETAETKDDAAPASVEQEAKA